MLLSCSDDKGTNPDNNDIYESVTIGEQVWMKYNLDVVTYRNGDTIPQVTDPDEWNNLTTGAWCYYDNEDTLGAIYGKLYNWYAVNDPRGLAPEGWRVPSDDDWKKLEVELGMTQEDADLMEALRGSPVGAKLAGGYDLWTIANTTLKNNIVFNSSGFSGLPGGYRNGKGSFWFMNYFTYWWTSTEYNPYSAIFRGLTYSQTAVYNSYGVKNHGISVRCIRD